jgi:uncharacterized protein (DUF1015 family)
MSHARTSSPAGPGGEPSGGLVLAPFRGLRFASDQVSDLAAATSPPYDVIDADSAVQLEVADPHNVVRIILPRPDAGDGGPHARYRHAGKTLRGWIAAGALVPDPEPGLYVYEQDDTLGGEGSVHRGLIGALGLRSPEAGVVLPHEDVMPAPVADRLHLMRATAANVEPILLAYEGGGPASDVIDESATGVPLAETTTTDGIRHRLWQVTDPDALAAVAADLRPRQALIADGHHRYATYLRLQAERHAAGDGPGPWDYGLALLVDSARYPLRVAAIHRVMPALPPGRALERAARAFKVTPVGDDLDAAMAALGETAPERTAFVLADEDRFWLLSDADPALVERTVPPDRTPGWRTLDAAVLHAVLLEAVWQVPDTFTDVRYHHSAPTAVRTARRGGGTAVLLRPVPESLVRRLAAAGERMPRKSTSFGPKPRNGLVLRTFEAG